MRPVVSAFLVGVTIATPAQAHFPPHVAAPWRSDTTSLIRHFAIPVPYADQSTIDTYMGCAAPLPVQSLFWVNGYNQDTASWNWAAPDGPRVTWSNLSWDLSAGGYRGNGVNGFGSTALYPGGNVSLGIPTDANLSVTPGSVSAQLSEYVGGTDIASSNPAGGAGGIGGSVGLLAEGPDSTGAVYRMLSSTNTKVKMKTPIGYYESTVNPNNPIPADIYESKDQVTNVEAGGTYTWPADASQSLLYAFGSGSSYGLMTLGSFGFGAGDTVAQAAARTNCVTNLLLGLNIVQANDTQQEAALPAYYGNPWAPGTSTCGSGGSSACGYTAGTTSPSFMFRVCQPPLSTDNHTTFGCFPGSAYETRDPASIVSTNVNVWVRDWYPRRNVAGCVPTKCNKSNPDVIPAPSDSSGNLYESEYSTEANSDACVMARLDYMNSDMGSAWLADLTANGSTLLGYLLYATVAASPSTYYTTPSPDGRSLDTLDECVMPDARVSFSVFVAGIKTDYEVNERTDVTGYIRYVQHAESMTCKGGGACKTFFQGDAWSGGNIAGSGLGEEYPSNTELLKNNVTYIDVALPGSLAGYTGKQELEYAIGTALLGTSGAVNLSQIVVYPGMSLSTDQDMIDLYNLYNGATDNGRTWGPWAGEAIWMQRVSPGGITKCLNGSTNKKFAELTTGTCS